MQKRLVGHETEGIGIGDVESTTVGEPQPVAASARRGDDMPTRAIAIPSQRPRNQRKLWGSRMNMMALYESEAGSAQSLIERRAVGGCSWRRGSRLERPIEF